MLLMDSIKEGIKVTQAASVSAVATVSRTQDSTETPHEMISEVHFHRS
jgi:hypothetical protein